MIFYILLAAYKKNKKQKTSHKHTVYMQSLILTVMAVDDFNVSPKMTVI